MNELIKNDIINILKESLKVIDDPVALAELSNHINHNSSIFQDEDSISIAILIFSLSKLFYREEKTDKNLVRYLEKALYYIENDNIFRYREVVRDTIREVKKRDKKLGYYITDILSKAGVKKGTKLVYNGISLGRVAQLMGITQWELIDYLGKTNIIETFEKTPFLSKRIKLARRLFNIE